MKMPEQYLERTIANLPPDYTGWTVPWAIWVCDDGTMLINTRYAVYDEPGGTAQMAVRRQGDGFAVTFPETERFTRSGNPPHMGASEDAYAPIVVASVFAGSYRR